MPLPTPLQEPKPEPVIPKRTLISRFDIEPTGMKRLKSPAVPVTSNPLSDSESETSIIEEKPKKKKKSVFQKYGETISQTKEELERRDRRMQRFSDIQTPDSATTPMRVDTPDYVRDAQIAASIVWSSIARMETKTDLEFVVTGWCAVYWKVADSWTAVFEVDDGAGSERCETARSIKADIGVVEEEMAGWRELCIHLRSVQIDSTGFDGSTNQNFVHSPSIWTPCPNSSGEGTITVIFADIRAIWESIISVRRG